MAAADVRLAIAVLALAGFVWLLVGRLKTAWNTEQEWKAREQQWRAAHPEQQPTRGRQASGQLASLAAVIGAVILGAAYGLNLLQIAAIAAVPVLLARRWRSYRRAQDAANAERFGSYTPSFRDRP